VQDQTEKPITGRKIRQQHKKAKTDEIEINSKVHKIRSKRKQTPRS
jgi:hypothetical protein